MYIGQVFAGMWIPCHLEIDYDDPDWSAKASPEALHECAGAAIFRANCDLQSPESLSSPQANRKTVFADPIEFLAYHSAITKSAAGEWLRKNTPRSLAAESLENASARVILIDRDKIKT